MHRSFMSVLVKAGRVLAAVGLVGSLAIPTLPAFAAAATVTVTPGTLTVPLGGSGTLTVNVTTDTPSLGFQMGATFDPTRIAIDSVQRGTNNTDSYLDTYAATPTGGGSVTPVQPFTINNTAGTIAVGGVAILGSIGPGFVGTGPAITIRFHALQVNGTSNLNLTSVTINQTPTQPPAIVNNAVITTGSVPTANLVVQNPSTTAVTGTPTQFNVGFVVANIGTAAAPAGTAAVAVTGATPATASVPVGALAAGANSGPLTAGPFTLATGSTLANITITTASNNTGTTAYQFAALTSTGNTPLNASLAGFLQLTAPPGVTSFNFTPGQLNRVVDPVTTPTSVLNIRSNVAWQVTVSGDNTGHFNEYNGTTYVSPGAQLIQALIARNGTTSQVTLTGSPQAFVAGTRAASDPNLGNNYPIGFDQFVGFNDQPVNAPNRYRIVVAWTANGTF